MLGVVSPIMILGKIICSDICQQKLGWDEQVPIDIERRWKLWIKGLNLQDHILVPRSVVEQSGAQLSLHGFSNASKNALCAVIYVVATYSDRRISKNLLTSRAKLKISDNAKTFQATKKWLETLKNDEDVNNYLANHSIKLQFTLSRAPCWGGGGFL